MILNNNELKTLKDLNTGKTWREAEYLQIEWNDTMYEFSLDGHDWVIYRTCGFGKGCYFSNWKENGQFID